MCVYLDSAFGLNAGGVVVAAAVPGIADTVEAVVVAIAAVTYAEAGAVDTAAPLRWYSGGPGPRSRSR